MKKLLAMMALLVFAGAACKVQPLGTENQDTGNGIRDKGIEESLDRESKDEEQNQDRDQDQDKEPSSAEAPAGEQDQAHSGREVLGDLVFEADDNSVVVLLSTLDEEDHDNAYIAFGCQNQLVPVKRELEKEMSDLAHAIVELLTIKKSEYEEQGLHNAISGLGITLENIKYEDGLRVIELEGQPSLSGVCEDARIQAQMEETIRLYSDNFEIRLNGSAQDWENLFSGAGE